MYMAYLKLYNCLFEPFDCDIIIIIIKWRLQYHTAYDVYVENNGLIV